MSRRTENKYVVLGEHIYQPPRVGSHARLVGIHSDEHGTDWNRIIAQECYIPQTKRGTLEIVSFDFYATIRREMLSLAPVEARRLKEAMRKRGVGDPYLHVLLPDLSLRDKKILISAGYLEFKKETGVKPKWFWAPETALDTETLEVLAEVGYTGVLCAPEQIVGIGVADNQPVKISLAKGRTIFALGFDRPFSSTLAFADKSNADSFRNATVLPRLQHLPESIPLIGWTDGETFGHHAKLADLFLDFLVRESLPSAGIAVLGVNELHDVWEKRDYKKGKLQERSAWSCPHGNLIRWHGACPCDGGYHGGWKEHFSNALSYLNQQVDAILDTQLGKKWPEQLAREFPKQFYFKGSRNSNQSLLAAKASALAAMTSCGTFFENPITSGAINMLFARQVFEHLIDAGFEQQTTQLRAQMLSHLSRGRDPFTGKQLSQLFTKQLG